MKVLSLMQPWATLVVMGIKKIETRSWTTAYRGDLLIHAGKSQAGKVFAAVPAIQKHIPDFSTLPFGQIIGQAKLTSIVRVATSGFTREWIGQLALEEKAFGNYDSSRFCWLLEEALLFEETIPATGRLGLWEW